MLYLHESTAGLTASGKALRVFYRQLQLWNLSALLHPLRGAVWHAISRRREFDSPIRARTVALHTAPENRRQLRS
jgi:hypothetical protein